MIKLISLSLLFVSTVHATPVVKSATNLLEIKAQSEKVEIQLPDTAFRVLNQWNPQFTVFSKTDYSKSVLEMFNDDDPSQLPMAFIEDLDGNDKKDIVLFGTDLKKKYVIAILQREKKWTLVKVAQWSVKNSKDSMPPIATSASGTAKDQAQDNGVLIYILPAVGEHATKLKEKKKVGIQVETYLGSGDVYEIVKNKAVKFILPQSP